MSYKIESDITMDERVEVNIIIHNFYNNGFQPLLIKMYDYQCFMKFTISRPYPPQMPQTSNTFVKDWASIFMQMLI